LNADPDPDQVTQINADPKPWTFYMQGKPVVISPEDERMHVDLFQSNGFSGFASDKVTFSLVG
jgi:hypothetical protein